MEQESGLNPYRSPQAELDDGLPAEARAGAPLAGRGARFVAALIDALLSLGIVLPVQYSFGMFDGFPNIQPQSLGATVMWGLFGFALWCVLHGYFIIRGGQTIGKRLLGIRVVSVSDGKPADLGRYALLRALPLSAISVIPYVGGLLALVDVLLIFRDDRRCAHDLIAGTRVVELNHRG